MLHIPRSKNVLHRRGVSLLELAIVTVIIGVLATATMPTFHRGLEQSRADLAAARRDAERAIQETE